MNFTNQTKTRSQKIKETAKRPFIFAIAIIGAVLIASAPFVHMAFPKTNPEVSTVKKNLQDQENLLLSRIDKAFVDFSEDRLDKDEFISETLALKEELKSHREIQSKTIKVAQDENRVFGWLTTRKWLIGFGVRLPYLFYSILLSYLFFALIRSGQFVTRAQRNAFKLLQVASYGISFYFLFWVFWTSQDFPVSAYRWAFIIASAILGLATVEMIIHYGMFKTRLEKVVSALATFIIKDARPHLKEDAETQTEYIKGYTDAMKKGIE